jgi:hypothetical protein
MDNVEAKCLQVLLTLAEMYGVMSAAFAQFASHRLSVPTSGFTAECDKYSSKGAVIQCVGRSGCTGRQCHGTINTLINRIMVLSIN